MLARLTLVASAGLLASCSLSLTDPADCETNAQCRFRGALSVCGEEGLCEAADPPARCSTFPEELDSDEEYQAATVLGYFHDAAELDAERALRSAQLAVQLVNRAGGVADEDTDRRFGLLVCDVQSDFNGDSAYGDGLGRLDATRAVGAYAVDELQLPAILGPLGARETRVLFEEFTQPAEVLLMTTRASSEALHELESTGDIDNPGLLWQAAPVNTAVRERIAQNLAARGVTQVQIVTESGPLEDDAVRLANRIAGANVEIVTYSSDNAGSEVGLVGALNTVATAPAAEVVLLSGRPSDARDFVELAVGEGRLDDSRFFLNDHASGDTLLEAMATEAFGPEGEQEYRIRVADFIPPGSTTQANFRNQYRGQFDGQEPLVFPVVAQTWDAVWLLMYGVALAVGGEGIQGVEIARGLRAQSDTRLPTQVPVGASSWQGVSRMLSRTGATVNLDGASGSLDFDITSENLTAEAETYVIQSSRDGWVFAPEPPSVPPP